MKTFSKIILVLVSIFSIEKTEAQPHKRIYNDAEVILPNQLKYNTADELNILKVAVTNQSRSISWQTTAETNTSHFELQLSKNGTDFEPIESITAGGSSTGVRNYSTTDLNIASGSQQLYYRLKMVFVNGKEAFSPIARVNIKIRNAAKSRSTITKNP